MVYDHWRAILLKYPVCINGRDPKIFYIFFIPTSIASLLGQTITVFRKTPHISYAYLVGSHSFKKTVDVNTKDESFQTLHEENAAVRRTGLLASLCLDHEHGYRISCLRWIVLLNRIGCWQFSSRQECFFFFSPNLKLRTSSDALIQENRMCNSGVYLCMFTREQRCMKDAFKAATPEKHEVRETHALLYGWEIKQTISYHLFDTRAVGSLTISQQCSSAE